MLYRLTRACFSTATVLKKPLEGEDLRVALIRASLLHIHRFGWNTKAIQAGCHELNLSSASHGILSNGAYDVADYLMREWHRKTMMELREIDLESLKVR